MPQINKVVRERNIKQVSRLEDLQPATEKITPKVIPKVQNKVDTKVEPKETLVNDIPSAPFKAAQKASIAAIRHAKTLAESSDKNEDQEAIDKIESTGRDAVFDAHDITSDVKDSVRQQIRKKRPDIKNTKDIKTGTRTIRKADKAVKTSAESTQLAVKSTIEASKQAAIASQKIATAKKAEHLSKKAAESVKKIVKGIIKAIKELCTGLEIASVPIMLVIVIASAIAALVASAFGIFFTGDVSGESTKTLQEVVLEINQGYNNYIEEIKTTITHDDLVIEGYGASWSDVIAVYAVFMTTKTDGATDVVHMTEEHEKVLYDIFWTMNSVTYTTEEVTVTEKVPDLDDDGNQKKDSDGNLLYIEQEKTTITLRITLDHVTAQQEADVLYFNAEQMAELNELLDPKNAPLWAELLRGMGLSSSELANLALSQLGNEGGEKFWKWAGLDERCPTRLVDGVEFWNGLGDAHTHARVGSVSDHWFDILGLEVEFAVEYCVVTTLERLPVFHGLVPLLAFRCVLATFDIGEGFLVGCDESAPGSHLDGEVAERESSLHAEVAHSRASIFHEIASGTAGGEFRHEVECHVLRRHAPFELSLDVDSHGLRFLLEDALRCHDHLHLRRADTKCHGSHGSMSGGV